jgi:hypothetical protein
MFFVHTTKVALGILAILLIFLWRFPRGEGGPVYGALIAFVGQAALKGLDGHFVRLAIDSQNESIANLTKNKDI